MAGRWAARSREANDALDVGKRRTWTRLKERRVRKNLTSSLMETERRLKIVEADA
jgi:hypothetical protein